MAKTVMVVDDSSSLRMVVNLTLKKAGFEVIEACDGKEALDKLTGQKINLVVCDVNMPNVDGISFLKAIRAMPNYKFTPVIMLTTESHQSKMQEGKDAGAKAWMIKPFKPEQILAAVEKLVLP